MYLSFEITAGYLLYQRDQIIQCCVEFLLETVDHESTNGQFMHKDIHVDLWIYNDLSRFHINLEGRAFLHFGFSVSL